MRKKKVLIVAYYFPPTGGGAIQRTIKLVKYLSRLGWEPYVLTVKGIHYKAYDETPIKEIPDILVIRAGSLGPLRIAHILRGSTYTGDAERITDFRTLETRSGAGVAAYSRWQRISKVTLDVLFPPDIAVFWVPFAIARGLEVCYKHGIDAIYSISPQESAHLVGNGLRKLTGLPWVTDLTDPWSNRHWRLKQPVFTRFINRAAEQSVFNGTDSIVVSTAVLGDYVKTRVPGNKPVEVIGNGYDVDDYRGNKLTKNAGDFAIVHIGNFTGGRGGENIIEGFATAVKTDKAFDDKAKLFLLGVNSIVIKALIRKFNLGEKVFCPGYLPYGDAVRAAASADLNLLQMGTEVGETVVPGKFYIYAGAEKPIMAVVPEGEAKRLVNDLCKSRFIAPPEDVKGIADAFLRAFRDNSPQQIDWERAKKFDYTNIAGEVASLLDRLTT